jgi:hypothetical protein
LIVQRQQVSQALDGVLRGRRSSISIGVSVEFAINFGPHPSMCL